MKKFGIGTELFSPRDDEEAVQKPLDWVYSTGTLLDRGWESILGIVLERMVSS